MIRSLAKPIDPLDSTNPIIRRNLSPEKLSGEFQESTSVWTDLVDADKADLDWLQQHVKLHPLVVQDLKRIDSRPSLLTYTDHIFISIFQPEMSLGKIKGHEIHCIIGENYFVTVRGKSSTGVDKAYERVAQNPNYWSRDVSYFLYLTVQEVVDKYYPIVDQISNQLNTLEEELLTSAGASDKVVRAKVYRLKQNLIALRQMIAPHREVLSSVIGEERLARSGEDRDLFRHLYERLMRVYDIVDAQRDLSSNVLDLLQNRESQEFGKAVNRLTVFSMIFLPLTFLIGLFELNFISPQSPFLIPISGTALFITLIVVMLVLVGSMLWYFRKQGWL
ncbi:MAG: magnesium transporter CorA family protein [Phototrophicaceae bacterium]|jgi:magnesium transporter